MKRCYASAAANVETPPVPRDSRRHFGTIGPHFTPPPLLPPPRLIEATAGALPLPPPPPPPPIEAVTTASAFQSRSAGMPPPPQVVNPAAQMKVEAPRAPHLYPSQSLFPRDSAATDAMIGLKTLATHAGTQPHIGTPPRPLQLSYRDQQQRQQLQPQQQYQQHHARPSHGYDLPALHIPQPQQYQGHTLQSVRPGGDAATPVRPDGRPLQQSLLPPPVITRRASREEPNAQRQQQTDVYSSPATVGTVRRLPPMTQSPPPLVSLLGRKNKRGVPRVPDSVSSSQALWYDASQGRLDPTASPPRPLTSPPRHPPSKMAGRVQIANPPVTKPPSSAVTTMQVPLSSPVARSAARDANTRSGPVSTTIKPPPLVRRVSNSQWRQELAPRDRTKTRERIQRGLHTQCEGDYDTLVTVLAALEEELLHIRTNSREHYFDQALELSNTIASAQLERASTTSSSPPR